MRFACFSLAVYFLLTIAGGAFGASLNDRFLMVAGGLPGMLGIVGLLVWFGTEDGQRANREEETRLAHKRMAKRHARYEASRKREARFIAAASKFIR